MRKYWLMLFLLVVQSIPALAMQPSRLVYQQSIHMASQGQLSQAIIALQAASAVLPKGDVWRDRMLVAAILLQMREQQSAQLQARESNDYITLANRYIEKHPKPQVDTIWPVALLASIFPGAGHAWLGRWHDAIVAAALVWPLLILTLWAARRKMGPVTVFFALLTIWLWSGTVFSAISLAERGSLEVYMQWWQPLWLASGLPSQVW